MKKLINIAINTLFLMSITIAAGQDIFKADVANSVINWKGFKPTGNHYGTVQIKDGSFTVTDKVIVSGEFDMDMNSIVVLDMPADNKYNVKLVGHLKSDDFFGVKNYPTAKFKMNSTETKGDKTMCSGDLIIKGISHKVSFLATIIYEGEKIILKSDTFKIDRSKWDIKFKSKSFFSDLGDNFIYDDIELSVEVTAVK